MNWVCSPRPGSRSANASTLFFLCFIHSQRPSGQAVATGVVRPAPPPSPGRYHGFTFCIAHEVFIQLALIPTWSISFQAPSHLGRTENRFPLDHLDPQRQLGLFPIVYYCIPGSSGCRSVLVSSACMMLQQHSGTCFLGWICDMQLPYNFSQR